MFCNSNYFFKSTTSWDFPGGALVKNLPCNAGDMGLILGQGTDIPNAETKNPHTATRVCETQQETTSGTPKPSRTTAETR